MKLIDAKTMLKELIETVEKMRMRAERKDRKHFAKKEYEVATWFHGQRMAFTRVRFMLSANLEALEKACAKLAKIRNAVKRKKKKGNK